MKKQIEEFDNEFEFILANLKPKLKSGNWFRFDCPVCIHNGEKKPDKRTSGGLTIDAENNKMVYHCFRCNYKASYSTNKPLNKKFKFLLKNFGFHEKDISKLEFSYLNFRKNSSNEKILGNFFTKTKKTKKYSLPKKTYPIIEIYKKHENNKNFINVLNYILSRGQILFEEYPNLFYWNEETPNLLYMPFFLHEKIIGYITKNTITEEYRLHRPRGYFFNQNVLYDEKIKYILVTEGPFDALSVGGIAVCGNKLSNEMIEILKKAEKNNKIIVIVPDRNVEINSDFILKAEENNWFVSLPAFSSDNFEMFKWDDKIKDCNEALINYGKFYTVLSILKNLSKNYFYIKTTLTLNKNNREKRKNEENKKVTIYDEISAILKAK